MLREIFVNLRNADKSDFPETEDGRQEWLRRKWAEARKEYDDFRPEIAAVDVKSEEVE